MTKHLFSLKKRILIKSLQKAKDSANLVSTRSLRRHSYHLLQHLERAKTNQSNQKIIKKGHTQKKNIHTYKKNVSE